MRNGRQRYALCMRSLVASATRYAESTWTTAMLSTLSSAQVLVPNGWGGTPHLGRNTTRGTLFSQGAGHPNDRVTHTIDFTVSS